MMLSTMSLDSLFLSLLISRPAVEKIRSDGMDVEGTTRARLAIIEILEYFNSFLARLHEVQKSYCSHPGRTRSRSRSRSTLR